MSLNGLDDPRVAEAYEAAAAEPGGWFLLKYSSRDEVELLGHGGGGVAEIRSKIDGYDEASPLYGFLRYRRRNVIIKYLPDDCSRLVQARVAVHFTAVCDRFSPHDSKFEMATPDELRDSKLSAACSLHAASGSNSSSSSLRRKHLMEIAEEDEDDAQQQQPAKRQSLIKDDADKRAKAPPEEPVKLNADLATSPEHSKFSAPSTSEVPSFVGAAPPPAPPDDLLLSPDAARRMSSQSGRPEVFSSYSAYSSYSSYSFGKSKVKLGPRPSLETGSNRPQTAGNFRPVSSIPAGFKLFGKNGSAAGRKQSSSSGRKGSVAESVASDASAPPLSPRSEIVDASFAAAAAAAPIPEEAAARSNIDDKRPATSSGVSAKSGLTSSKPTMTPEKARLKKAMQLREKKKRKAANKAPPVPEIPAIMAAMGEAPSIKDIGTEEAAEDQDDTLVEPAEQRASMVKSDSGIGIDAAAAAAAAAATDGKEGDGCSEHTLSDSHPASPVVGSSETEQSTKASSISESTDQTVEAPEAKQTPQNPEPDVADEKPADDDSVEPRTAAADNTSSSSSSSETTPTATAAAAAEEATVETGIAVPENTLAAAGDQAPETQQIPDWVDDARATTDEANAQATTTTTTTTSSSQLPPPPPAQDEHIETRAPAADDTNETTSDAETISPQVKQEEASITTRQQQHRKLVVEPIRTDLAQHHSRPTSQSEINFSDSESLLEELQSATVQEARPMLVAKTPRTPVFPGQVSVMGVGVGGDGDASPPPASPASPSQHQQPLRAAQNQNATGKPVMVRAVSSPVRGSNAAAATRGPAAADVSSRPSTPRHTSHGAAYLHQVTQQRSGDGGLPKKVNVGSSISQRIKALELLSASSAADAAGAPAPGSRPSSMFFSVKKDRVPSRSPSVADRAQSLSRDRNRPTTAHSGEYSPETLLRTTRDRSGSISSRLSVFETANSPGGTTPRGRPETISVTARILRDTPNDHGSLDLRQSPLLVDHQRGMDAAEEPIPALPAPEPAAPEHHHHHQPATTTTTTTPRGRSKEGGHQSRRSSSFSLMRDFIKDGRKSISSPSTDNLVGAPSPTRPPSTHHTSNSITRRLSIGSRRSLSKDRDNTVVGGVDGSADADETRSNSDKRKSRAGRFMHRLSNLSGSSRGKLSISASGTPTTVTEEILPGAASSTSLSTATAESPSVETYMGDVNVQFPDTLLWKRRNMYLDSHGFVVLSSLPQQRPQSQHHSRSTGIRRFHLGDFKQPYAPDVEVQELPNSVVLDLVEGSSVQVACEDRAGQMYILQTLRDAHAAYAGQ